MTDDGGRVEEDDHRLCDKSGSRPVRLGVAGSMLLVHVRDMEVHTEAVIRRGTVNPFSFEFGRLSCQAMSHLRLNRPAKR